MKILTSTILLLFFLLSSYMLYSAPVETVVDGLKTAQKATLVPIKVGEKIIFIPVGSGIPPDPGEVGDQTIQGIDSDNDGIRDDVERKIGIKYSDNPEKRAYSYFLAMKYQDLINSPNSLSINDSASKEIYQAESCLDLLQGNTEEIGSDYIIPIVMNTPARTRAYIKSLGVGAGEVINTLEFKECGK